MHASAVESADEYDLDYEDFEDEEEDDLPRTHVSLHWGNSSKIRTHSTARIRRRLKTRITV